MTEIQHKTKKTVFDHEVPNLVEVQIKSYEWFLKEGFKEVLDSFSPITNYDRSYSLEFIGDPIFEEPNNTEEECRRNMTTYDGAIKVKVQVSKRDEKGVITSTVEDIHLAYLPKMTANGTFFINGAERVVVSQLYRSPGAYFDDNFDNTGKQLYFGKIQPSDGSWLEIHTDNNELKAKIGQSAVFPVTILLRSFNQFHDLCPYPVDSLLGKTFKDIHFLDEKEADECKKGFDFKDNKGDILVRLVPSKSKKSPDYETTVIEPKHIEKLKEYFGDYVYTSNFNSISTASDILNIFGYKEFVKISRLFPIRNYKKENNAVKEIDNEVISVPCKDKDNTLNGIFRVLSVDILNEKGKVLFKKGTKFDDPKLIMPLPKDSIFIGSREYDRSGCIEYLVTKGLNDKYTEAIDGKECTEENILFEWLIREQTIIENTQKVKPLYNIINMCPVNDIIDEATGEVLCSATGIIRDTVADYLYNNSESVYLEVYNVPQLISKTLNNENPKPDITKGIKPVDPVVDDKTALLAFQRFLRPLEPASEEAAKSQIINQFIDNKNYNLGKVGRYKLNRKLGLNLPVNAKACRGSKYKAKPTTREDLIKLIKYTIYLSKEGKIVTEFFPERKQAILDKISEYIKLVKKGKINGVDAIVVKETIDQSDSQKGSKILVNVSRSKYSKTEDKVLDGRNAMYARFYSLIENMEYGSLFTKDEYIRLTEFLKAVNEDFGGEFPYLEAALSDSPQNLKAEYVLARVNLCITDEIDNLENKRVRPVGELLQERLIEGIKRMEKNVLDKMNQSDREKMAVNNLINSKPISGALKGFFGTDQLSQFMDQTNPLAELTHKRRLSSLGRGGLMRQSAKIEVRDVHHSHYGRICPIETPEGPNIGLIGSMAIHARINDFGFIETPYRIVRNGVITDEIRYFSAEEESHEYIANAGIAYDEETKQITEKNTVVRHNGKYPRVDCQKITLMEVSPNQIMSVAANLIPFIENDDANRALMGSNMQRQAVPLLKPTAPIVRTGIEKKAAHDSGVEQFAKRAGKVVWVSCENIVVLPEEPDYIDRYEITFTKKKKYDHRDNLFTCVKKTYAFDDKEYKNLLSETIIPVNSVINRIGKSSEMNLDGTDYLCIDPEKNTVVLIPVCENLEKGDLIFDGKIYRGKNKKYEFTGSECDCFSGIVSDIKTVQVPVEENSDETEEKLKLEISELDLYSMVPETVRSAFPPAYAVIRFGKIEIVADTAGVGCGNNNKVVLENPAENQWVFDVTVCDSNRLINMTRSNQGTCINSRAVVEIGRRVYKDELLADGPCTDHGELALGQNVTVAFLPWNGYNYEDAILLNEKLVKDDKFSSVHIEKYEIEARDTKNGAEEITRDIPNVKEDDLKDLDERGIIRIGAHVKAEGFLVGKIAPKGAKEPDSYDKLTRSIFGNNAELKRDVSLKVPHGESGTIVDVKVFSRYKFQCSNPDCSFTKEFCKKPEPEECFCEVCNSPLKQLPSDEINAGVNQLVRVYIAQKRKITKGDKMAGRHGNKGVISNIIQEADMPFKPDGVPVDIVLNPLGVPSRMNIGQILETHQGYAGTHLGLKFKNPIFQSSTEREIIADLEIMTSKKLVDTLLAYLKELEINVKVSDRKILKALNESIELVTEATGDELDKVADPLNNLKASIYDKVLSAVKEYDAYDLEILSRNLCCDQVIFDNSPEFETKLEHIKELNHAKFRAENSEDSMTDEECGMDSLAFVLDALTEAKSDDYEIPADYNYDKLIDAMEKVIIKRVGFHAKLAKTDLYDGKTGDKLHQSVCVGTIYMLKLHHLVDDKIHARATGPYSLVTQQPLGGKAQFGGQRFGEMEVWALEAYGAAYTLQEILTIKSDDVLGRVDTYESIVKGENIPLAGIPESFKILVNELQSLCLKITIEDKNGNAIDIRTYDDTPLKG